MTDFEVWAPNAARVTLRLYPGPGRDGSVARAEDRTTSAMISADGVAAEPQDLAMSAGDHGWYRLSAPDVPEDARYAFLLDDDEEPLPDPRAARLPDGVHEASQRVDHDAFGWTDQGWTGRTLNGAIFYELHVGTFTAEGTFDAAIDRLDHLVDLGVDMVGVMPVNGFEGERGWGYDGVAWYSVHEPYGGPDGFKRFVDACHARRLGVVLDVVYNHLGPSGAHLNRFGPYFGGHDSPWGRGPNLDGPMADGVRRYIVDNALMWLRDYHVDGLRLDAVHALRDTSAQHLLEELTVTVSSLSGHLRRPLTLVAESDLNDPRLVTSRESGGIGLDAQWSDDFHHALHAVLTGERQGYYGDFGPLAVLAKTLTRVYFHDGVWSSFRGRTHGRHVDVGRLPGYRFLGYLSNHDQVGNRALGDRLSASVSPSLLKVGAALVLTAPFTPMLFMGEEWGATTPWQFFTSFPDPELGRSVLEGRTREFGDHGWDALGGGDDPHIPDPQDPATRDRSVLDWSEPGQEGHADLLAWHRDLVTLRRSRPELTDSRLYRTHVAFDEDHRWLVLYRGPMRGSTVAVVCNLAGGRQVVPVDGLVRELLVASGSTVTTLTDAITLDGESVAVVTLG